MLFSTPSVKTYRVGLRLFLVVMAALITVCPMADVANSQVKVRGYYRKDGTYVRPHYRSSPDGNFWNNWSTKGNVNPYTGKAGTRVTPPKGYSGSRSSSSYASGYAISNPHYALPTPSPHTPTEPTRDMLRQISSINYHGIGFSTTHQHFLRMYPHAIPYPDDISGIVSYAIADIGGKRDRIDFLFLGDEFLRLGFAYHTERIQNIGGTSVFLDRMKEVFGPPSVEIEAKVKWQFPTIDRSIKVIRVDDYLYISITRDSVDEKVDRWRLQLIPESVTLMPLEPSKPRH